MRILLIQIKHLNSNLISDIYVGDDGKLHKVQGGADTVLNFSSGRYKYFKVTLSFANYGSYYMTLAYVYGSNDASNWSYLFGTTTPMNGNNSSQSGVYTN